MNTIRSIYVQQLEKCVFVLPVPSNKSVEIRRRERLATGREWDGTPALASEPPSLGREVA